MIKLKNGRQYSIYAAFCFVLTEVYSIITTIILYFKYDDYKIGFVHISSIAIAVGLIVTLFLNNKKAVAIVSGIDVSQKRIKL